MKKGCVPTKFDCQPDRTKRKSTTERPYVAKKLIKITIENAEKHFSETSTSTKHLESAEPSSGSSGTYLPTYLTNPV